MPVEAIANNKSQCDLQPLHIKSRSKLDTANKLQCKRNIFFLCNLMPVKIKSILFKKSPLRNIVWNRKLNHPCRRLNMTTISMVEPTGGVFSGDLVDYISDRSGFSGVPDLMFDTVTEIEKRLPIERKGIYCSRSGRVKDYLGELQVSQLKRLFLLDKTPNVRTFMSPLHITSN